jgi:hypothetical protein
VLASRTELASAAVRSALARTLAPGGTRNKFLELGPTTREELSLARATDADTEGLDTDA